MSVEEQRAGLTQAEQNEVSDPAESTWFIIDRWKAMVVAIPSLRGVDCDALVSVCRTSGKEIVAAYSVVAGGSVSIDLSPYARLFEFGLRLQRRVAGGWESVGEIQSLASTPDSEVHRITPLDWGVEGKCIVSLRDVQQNRSVLRVTVPAKASVTRVIDFPDGRKLQFDLLEPDVGAGAGKRLVPPMRLVPHAQRGLPDSRPITIAGGLRVSRRLDVVLAPLELASAGGPLATRGTIGAWARGEPIVEAMEYTLGRQRYQFSAMPTEVPSEVSGPVIYAGPTHGSWGHFLTQGLSRLWYAMRHPDVPILWDARVFPPYHQQVLDLLGISNPQLLLTEATRFSEVFFPYPGLSLGDYVLPEFAREVGVVRPDAIVPGKRILLTRARLGQGRGAATSEGPSDLESVAAAHGFTMFAPEEHSPTQQLRELSSAETVLGIEGSAFHTLLLLSGPIETRYWALTRHRGGSGVFQHIKDAKGLRYETLNFLGHGRVSARSAISLDLTELDNVLDATDGLSARLHKVEPYLEQPARSQTSFLPHIQNTQVRLTALEEAMSTVAEALRHRDIKGAQEIVAAFV